MPSCDHCTPELSDGQRSVFHLSMTATALDVEAGLAFDDEAFDVERLMTPVLTLVAVEEPENNLSPFYSSRIIRQLHDVAGRD